MLLRTALAIWWAVAALALPATSVAQPSGTPESGEQAEPSDSDRERARAAFKRGVAAAREGHWEDARRAFAEAHGLVRVPEILLNLAGAQRRTGRLVEAAASYRRFLELPEDRTRAEHREAARAALADIDPLLPHARIWVSGLAPEDQVELDGEVIVPGDRIAVNPGQHSVVVRRNAIILEQRGFEVDVGESEELTVEVAAAPSPQEAARGALEQEPGGAARTSEDGGDRSVVRSPWLWTGVGAVVVAGVVTAVVLAAGGNGTAQPFQGNVGPGTVEVP